jgi:hypothetical protein
MLNTRHNIQLSVFNLKRILRRMGLKRKNLDFDIDNVIQCISKELRGSASSMGYRAMHQKLRSVYNLQVDQETVCLCLKNLDPRGVEERSRRRLRHHVYVSKGPNYQWHIDGYHKLRPFGFFIHGCIDGFSRKILWLELAESNHDPKLIANYFVDSVTAIRAVPSGIQADRGTENVIVAAIQRWLHWSIFGNDDAYNSFQYVRSNFAQIYLIISENAPDIFLGQMLF